jgi:hypothetical protein
MLLCEFLDEFFKAECQLNAIILEACRIDEGKRLQLYCDFGHVLEVLNGGDVCEDLVGPVDGVLDGVAADVVLACGGGAAPEGEERVAEDVEEEDGEDGSQDDIETLHLINKVYFDMDLPYHNRKLEKCANPTTSN